MNAIHGHPEVTTFVDLVRLFLSDLDDEVRDELAGGLEADMADLVDDRGVDALPDPELYAEELRSAAGLPPRAIPPRVTRLRSLGPRVHTFLDQVRDRWLSSVGSGGLRPIWEFVVVLRPAWWLLRGWIAWMVALDMTSRGIDYGDPVKLAALGLAVVGSVQLGRRRWGTGRLVGRADARLLLVALNVFAVTMLPSAVDRQAWAVAEERAHYFSDTSDATTPQQTEIVRQQAPAERGGVADRR